MSFNLKKEIDRAMAEFDSWPEPKRKAWKEAMGKEYTGPAKAPIGLLMSMAIRYDHALAIEGYYDQEIFGGSPGEHQRRLDATIITMRQIYEEVHGTGFYQPEAEEYYSDLYWKMVGSKKS